MSRSRALVSRLFGLLRKRRSDEDLDAELYAHLQLLAEENMRQGMSAEDARRAARREFGGLEQTKEAYREQRGIPYFDALLQDLRFGVRMLVNKPVFTAVAALTLAIGIGSSSAVF